MNKRLVKSVLGLMLASVVLTACSGGSKPANNDTQVSTESSDGKGIKTLKIMGGVDADMWDTIDNQPVYAEFEKMLEEAGVKLEIEAIVKEQYEQVLKTRTAAAIDLPDIVNITSMDVPTAVNLGEKGIFQDVKPLVEQHSNGNISKLEDQYLPNFWGTSVTDQGNAYWFPCWYKATYDGTEPFSSILTPLIRYDWLEKIGVELPKTADDFVNVLEQMRIQDVNESGKEDEVLIFTPSFNVFGPLFGLPSRHISVDITDNTAKSPWLMKEQLIPYIEFLKSLVDRGILDIDSLDKPSEYVLQKINGNKVSAQTGYANTDFYSENVKPYDGDYGGVIFTGGTGEQYVQAELPDFVYHKLAITKACKDPEAAVRFLDVIATPEFATLHRYGLEGDGHTIENGVLVPSPDINSKDYNLEGHGVGHFLWAELFGSLSLEAWESLRVPFEKVGNERVLDFGNNHSTGDHKYYYSNYQLAIQTQAEIDNESKLWADLNTYMNETLMKLALGQYDMKDLDQYIEKMKSLGLETMLADYQARHDRFLGK